MHPQLFRALAAAEMRERLSEASRRQAVADAARNRDDSSLTPVVDSAAAPPLSRPRRPTFPFVGSASKVQLAIPRIPAQTGCEDERTPRRNDR